ncbi:hypothetical protein BGZ95_009455 [Linnemannia exigua]|uniref:Uncharacterized protein n=1 Tax=Linnemannia exigua TaxID=604196 RepID=A0AAD4DKN6_9FUNG|nr:hypothetical protein BGZ95_009455 [Linnemannia exigua]
MSGPIQDGRYRIWRSPEQQQLVVTMAGSDSMAVLSHPGQLEDPEKGIWIVSSVTTPSNTVNLASADAVSATVQHEVSKAYLALDKLDNPSRGSPIYVRSKDRQVWTLSPASTTGGEGASKNEFHIGYPDLVDGEVLVVDNSFARSFPPRLALQPLGADIGPTGLPWQFELVD